MSYRLFSFAMALFWIFVQQACLCCVRLALSDLGGWGTVSSRRRDFLRFLLLHGTLLLFLAILAAGDLWFLPHVHAHRNNSPSLVWQFFCTVMLALDGGLLSAEWRIFRLHASGGMELPEKRDSAFLWWTAACLLLYGIYFRGALSAAFRLRLSLREWEFLCLFYFRIINGLYFLLEGAMGMIAFLLYRNLKREGGRHGIPA